MSFNYDYSYKRNALDPCNRFTFHSDQKFVDKPQTPYEKLLYNTLFQGKNIKNCSQQSSYLTDKWFIPTKNKMSLSLEGFSVIEAINPISWIKNNEFIISYQNSCVLIKDKKALNIPAFDQKETINAIHTNLDLETIAISRDGSYGIYDLEYGKLMFDPDLKSNRMFSKIHLMDQSCSFISGSEFYVQDLRSKEITTVYKTDSNKIWTTFDYTTRQNHVALGNNEGDLFVYDKRQEKPSGQAKLSVGMNQVKWEPKESYRVAAAKIDGSISIYSLNSGAFKSISEVKTESPVESLMWTAEKCLISGHQTEKDAIKVWDVRSMKLKGSIDCVGGAKYLSPNLSGKHFAVIGENLSVFETPHPI